MCVFQKKVPTSSTANLEIAKEPTRDGKQTDVCDTSAACIVRSEDLITDTMMSSLREVSDACLDDCTTMVGGIGSADIMGLTDRTRLSANADNDCDLSMSTDGVHDKLRSSLVVLPIPVLISIVPLNLSLLQLLFPLLLLPPSCLQMSQVLQHLLTKVQRLRLAVLCYNVRTMRWDSEAGWRRCCRY